MARHETLDEWNKRTGDIPMPRADKKIQWQVDYERRLSRCAACNHAFTKGEIAHISWENYQAWCLHCLPPTINTIGHTRSVEAGAVDEEEVLCMQQLKQPYIDLRKLTPDSEP